ncbi:MAG: RNA polymerase sigma factor [bacterium]|jgi:RNA polymerase sigma-70 factor (ECF subfamily)|nr:RNA polymerase sigma factor [bacterium]
MSSIQRSLEQFYQTHARSLLIVAMAITHRQDLAEEAIHSVFCSLLSRQESPKNQKAFIFTCVRNAAIDLIRKEKRQNELEAPFIFAEPANPRQVSEEKELQEAVLASLKILTPEERETVVQHLYADLTFREIAEIRGDSINTVMSWYRRGLEKIRNRLDT